MLTACLFFFLEGSHLVHGYWLIMPSITECVCLCMLVIVDSKVALTLDNKIALALDAQIACSALDTEKYQFTVYAAIATHACHRFI